MYLLIVEVSQKQAYIFRSLKLRDNVENSARIAEVVSKEYFNKITGRDNMAEHIVYSGGGHTVLEFDEKSEALEFAKKLTLRARLEFDGMELFTKIMEYDESLSPAKNAEELSKQLEIKKSMRKSAFRRKSFGGTRQKKVGVRGTTKYESPDSVKDKNKDIYRGYSQSKDFRDLTGEDEETGFIAVVHIDGNSMGARVADIRKRNYGSWEEFRETSKKFSECVDSDFKRTYDEMLDVVVDNMDSGMLKDISKEDFLPVRKLILEGDDVCFVCNGRIGLECANIFLEKLKNKINSVDNKNYYAAAGVCIVHGKFPFYRAYEIAERLCSNAKKMVAKMIADGKITEGSAIDWHIEYGEAGDTVEKIRKEYIADDNTDMVLRPYITGKDNGICYNTFRRIVTELMKDPEKMDISRGKLKELREAIKQGRKNAEYFIKINRMEDILTEPIYNYYKDKNENVSRIEDIMIKNSIYVRDSENHERCVVFDAIECADMFEKLEEVKKS